MAVVTNSNDGGHSSEGDDIGDRGGDDSCHGDGYTDCDDGSRWIINLIQSRFT